jgi:hypothetical protein
MIARVLREACASIAPLKEPRQTTSKLELQADEFHHEAGTKKISP